jgi:cadmium resistance transport/sequestration family protein
MSFPGTALILGIMLFAATDVDDLVILIAFFADPRFRAREVIVGQYLGIGALILVSIAAALIALVVPLAYVGFLGLIPIIIAVADLVDSWRGDDERGEDAQPLAADHGRSKVFAVAAVTIANGGDNIGVYVPLFAVSSAAQVAVIVAVFLLMTALWCALAHWLVHHRTIGIHMRRYGHRVLPFVLIAVGLFVMFEAGTLALLQSWGSVIFRS